MQGLQDDSSSSETTMKNTLKTREPDIAKTHKPSNVDILSKTSSKQREQNITEDQQRGEHAELLDFFLTETRMRQINLSKNLITLFRQQYHLPIILKTPRQQKSIYCIFKPN